MNDRYPLTATKRDAVGHRAKSVRKNGYIPATVYGKGIESMALSVEKVEFSNVFKKAGETHLVDLSIEGKSQPVLIHAVQRHPISQIVSHIEFLTVNLKEKLKMYVPIHVTGEAPAVSEKKGILMITLQEVEIETLPTNIPDSITVDVSSLTEVDQEIKLSELTIPNGVSLLGDGDLTVVKIGAIVVEEEAPAAPAAESTEGEAAPTAETPASADESPKTE